MVHHWNDTKCFYSLKYFSRAEHRDTDIILFSSLLKFRWRIHFLDSFVDASVVGCRWPGHLIHRSKQTMVTAASIIIPSQSPPQLPQLIEVIGGNGRIGSQFMRLLRQNAALSQQPQPIAVPRGICPGSISSIPTTPSSSSSSMSGSSHPIFVCTPSNTWSTIYEVTTPSTRCSDLVFVGNGLLPHNIAGLESHLFTDDDDDDDNTKDNATNHHHHHPVFEDMATPATTIVIPHYAILRAGDRPTTTTTTTVTSTDKETGLLVPPPPTVIAGKHSRMVQRLLRLDGITNLRRYDTITPKVIQYMVQKVVWTSCLWLLCHTMNCQDQYINQKPCPSMLSSSSSSPPPLTVSQVHIHHNTTLHALVEELWPSIQHVYHTEVQKWTGPTTIVPTMTLPDVIQYIEQYSFSIPNAIPSKVLAMQEINSRNYIFTSDCQDLQQEQPIHYRLLQQVFDSATTQSKATDRRVSEGVLPRTLLEQPVPHSTTKIIDVRSMIGMAVYGQHRPPKILEAEAATTTTMTNTSNNNIDLESVTTTRTKRVVIIGAGILGSSVAFNLARLQHDLQFQNDNESVVLNVTVIDAQCSDINENNETTKASFGWINANYMKQPLSYQNLNVFGIHAWYHDPVLKALPQWNGSLIRTTSNTNNRMPVETAGYYNQIIGPLSDSDLRNLEPNVTFSTGSKEEKEEDRNETSHVYYLPNEGFVDPCDAVRTIRNEADRRGVSFLWNCTVQSIVAQPPIIGTTTDEQLQGFYRVEYQHRDRPRTLTIDADVIVVAAGIGSSQAALGGLPMQETNCSGSTIQFVPCSNIHNQPEPAAPTMERPKEIKSLQRIVVDLVNETHIAQRRNGTVIVGGGSPLRVGGTNVVGTSIYNDVPIARKAQSLVPNVLDTMMIDTTFVADRPIPFDGLPSIGYYHRPDMVEVTILNDSTCSIPPVERTTPNFGGMYSLVSHSGITLAPLVGALAAVEILDPNLSLDILQPYRPARLFARKSQNFSLN